MTGSLRAFPLPATPQPARVDGRHCRRGWRWHPTLALALACAADALPAGGAQGTAKQTHVARVDNLERALQEVLSLTPTMNGFFADTDAARTLWRGCASTQHPEVFGVPKPQVLIVGPSKTGTTSLKDTLLLWGSCRHVGSNVFQASHLWKHLMASRAYWSECGPLDLKVDKSPSYFADTTVPKKVCETAPDARVVVVLRHPVDRAYSSYFQTQRRAEDFQFLTATLGMRPNSSLAFRNLVEVDMDIVQSCYGMPGGNMTTAEFRTCCGAVARRRGYDRWPGCTCHKLKDRHYLCTKYGDTRVMQVRKGLYAHHLTNWYSFFPPRSVLLVPFENLRRDEDAVARTIVRWASPATLRARGQYRDVDMLKGKEVSINSRTRGSMDSDTRELLFNFYRPYNDKLYELLGPGPAGFIREQFERNP
mmetsp:Transcript_1277/g.3587  ORF Transcript_1277/g.3587 Transcript_1277/m.3587 type:complete len:421 (-) Transcript_1277:182-1444(-)